MKAEAQSSNGALRIETVLDKSSVCRAERSLRVNTLILNESGRSVTIDETRIYRTVSIIALVDTVQMKLRNEAVSRSADRMGQPPRSSEMTIAPNGFLSVPLVIPLDGKFFENDGYYRLSLVISVGARDGSTVGSASNVLLFELASCE
jgi:hypothetical protein